MNKKGHTGLGVYKGKIFKCLVIESYEVSNDTVMIRLQKDTYGRGFNLESDPGDVPPTCQIETVPPSIEPAALRYF